MREINKMRLYMMVTFTFVTLCIFGQDDISPTYTPMFQANNSDPYNVPTPNQSTLGTFGTIPVSPYTGKANITIPLYSNKQRGVDLDINISYDTSGLLINQLPSWTGHNWSLQAGGTITRKINGRPDEISYKGTNAGRDMFLQYNIDLIEIMTHGQYFNEVELIDDGVYSTYHEKLDLLRYHDNEEVVKYDGFINYFTAAPSNVNNTSITAQTYADFSADIFYFNFLGFSGSFFYGNDGNWKVRSEQNIQVMFDVTDSTNYIESYENTLYFNNLSSG